MRRTATAGRAPGGYARLNRAEGGDYFASMTDLMLGLLFVFIIMLMAFALNLREAERKMSSATRELSEAHEARREMLHDIASLLKGHLPVSVDEENGTLQLGSDILFPRGSADTYPDALPKLRTLGAALDLVLPCYAVAGDGRVPARCAMKRKGRLEAVYIEGHTDTAPIRTSHFQNNWELSAARASETLDKLIDGSELRELRNDRGERLIGVSGYGEYRPVDRTGTEEGMKKNRRIELRFIMISPETPELSRLKEEIRGQNSP